MKKHNRKNLIKYGALVVVCASLLVGTFYIKSQNDISTPFGDGVGVNTPFRFNGTIVELKVPTNTLRIQSLANCDTIDTDADGDLACGTDATGSGGGGGTMIEIGAGNPNSGILVSSVSFDAGAFNVTNPTGYAFVQLDYTNGPASRAIAQTWAGLQTFSAGASGSNIELSGYASASRNYGAGLTACTSAGNVLRWTGGVFSCSTIADGDIPDNITITESDPQVDTVTNGNFCKGTGTTVSCTDSSTYITGNQTITLSGGATGSGATSIVVTIASESFWDQAYGWGNHSTAGYITDGNTGWDNSYGFTKLSSTANEIITGAWEFRNTVSASAFNGVAFNGVGNCTGANHLQWNSGLFSCASDTASSGGGASIQVRTYPGTTVSNIATVSFDGGKFVVSASTSTDASVNINWGVGGPASKAQANIWTGLQTFSAGASSSNIELSGYASASIIVVGTRGTSAATAIRPSGTTTTGINFPNGNTVTLAASGNNGLNVGTGGAVGFLTGTAALPAIYTGGNDTDTGWWHPSANVIGFSAGGTNTASISLGLLRLSGSASTSLDMESMGYSSASFYKGSAFSSIPGAECSDDGDTLAWNNGVFTCGTDASGGGGGANIEVQNSGTDLGSFSSISFDANHFTATDTSGEATIKLDWGAGGPASLSEAETISGNWVNIASPWADNEVADDITASNYYLNSNPSSFISDGNTNWDNTYGFVTTHNSNIPFITLGNTASLAFERSLAVDTANFTLSDAGANSTYTIGLASGLTIPLTASVSNWEAFRDTPSTRITAGTHFAWSTNTFGADAGYDLALTASQTAWEAFRDTPSTRISDGTGLTWSTNTLNVDDIYLLLGGDTATGLIQFSAGASASIFEATTYASASKLYGAGLVSCSGDNHLQWSAGVFTCDPDPAGVGGGGADTDIPFLTLGNTSSLSFERSLAVDTTNFTLTDGGADSTYTIGLASGLTIPFTASVSAWEAFKDNDVPLSSGGTGATLADPNADRLFMWDDSAGATVLMGLGGKLAFTATPTLTVASNSLSFGEFTASMSLDTTTEVVAGAFNYVINLDSTGDLKIEDNGTVICSISDTGVIDCGSAVAFEISNGTNPTFSAVGQVYYDSTLEFFKVATQSSGPGAVIPTKMILWSANVPSSSFEFVSGGLLPLPAKPASWKFNIVGITCATDVATSTVQINVSNMNGNNDTEQVTCDNDGQEDTSIDTNSRYAQTKPSASLEFGTVTNAPDYLTFTIYGYYSE